MKKILAVLLALAVMTACAAEDNSGAQSSTADGSGSEGSAYSEKSEDSSKESSSEQSHSSQQSGDPVPGEAGNTSGKTSSGSGSYSETSSAPELSSGSSVISVPPMEPILPGNPNQNAEAMENSYVKRVSTLSSNYIIWYHAENERADEMDRPIVVIENIDELNSFLMDMDGLYFQSYEENSAGTILRGYDEAFFEENVIILTHIQSNSGSVRYTVTGINVSGGLCTMNISAEMPEIGTADMADWFIFVEVPKDAVSGCSSYKMNIGF